MTIVHWCVLSVYNHTKIESDAIIACQKTSFEARKATQTTSLIIALLLSTCTKHDLGPKPVESSKQCISLDIEAVYCADKMRLPSTTCHIGWHIQNTLLTHLYLGQGYQNSGSSHKYSSPPQSVYILNINNILYYKIIKSQAKILQQWSTFHNLPMIQKASDTNHWQQWKTIIHKAQ